ncbi:MAG: COX15/CtaA family protein [Solirubrobacteraceae bacterium]
MANRFERLRERTNDYTLTPAQYAWTAYIALGALALIVMSGAAVRLTGSGLGCPHWPKCYGNVYPPLNTHAVIEFSNRLVTVPVSIAAIAAWVFALRRRPYRRDLTWLALALPLGVLGQAVLGGLTVKGDLDYGWVMGHFALSMIVVAAAAALAWRATYEPNTRPLSADRIVTWSSRALLALGALTIFAGTAATAAGPHAGGSPGQKINRLDFDGKGTMDFVIHRHGEIALVFGLLAVGLWWLVRKRSDDPILHRSLTVLCVLIALQGAVGLDQYETHLPTELVWVHVSLACLTWVAVLWSTLAAGSLEPQIEASKDVKVAPQRGPNLDLSA